MNIRFWLPKVKLSGGVRTIVTYAHWLKRFGYQVEVVVESKSAPRRFLANLLDRKPKWMHGYLNVPIRRTKSFLDSENFNSDIIVADSWGVVEKLGQVKTKAKRVHFIQHDERLYHGDPARVTKNYQLPFQKIVISNWLKKIITADFATDSDLVLTSFDQKIFHPVNGTRRLGEIRILILDHSYVWKGTKEGVETVMKLKEKYPQVRLIGFGVRRRESDMSYDEYYFDLPQSELATLYSSCDIYCCPSWHEGFGMPGLEALACGSCLVTYDNGGCLDYAHDGRTALVVPSRDQAAFYRALEQAVTNESLRGRLQAQGLELAATWPTWEHEARLIESLIA